MPTLKVAQDLIDLIYPVGFLFITTDKTFNPNNTLGGTWARLEGDVYLKNVPSSATSQPIGNYGGTTSNHTIPITSIPSHHHTDHYASGGGNYGLNVGGWDGVHYGIERPNFGATTTTGDTGGGQAYYPYYYGIICWHRIA